MRFALLSVEMLRNFGFNKVFVELAMSEGKFLGYYDGFNMSGAGLLRNYLLCDASVRGVAFIVAEDDDRSARGGAVRKSEARAEGPYSMDVSGAQSRGGGYLHTHIIGLGYGSPSRVRYSSIARSWRVELLGQLFPSEVQPLLLS